MIQVKFGAQKFKLIVDDSDRSVYNIDQSGNRRFKVKKIQIGRATQIIINRAIEDTGNIRFRSTGEYKIRAKEDSDIR